MERFVPSSPGLGLGARVGVELVPDGSGLWLRHYSPGGVLLSAVVLPPLSVAALLKVACEDARLAGWDRGPVSAETGRG